MVHLKLWISLRIIWFRNLRKYSRFTWIIIQRLILNLENRWGWLLLVIVLFICSSSDLDLILTERIITNLKNNFCVFLFLSFQFVIYGVKFVLELQLTRLRLFQCCILSSPKNKTVSSKFVLEILYINWLRVFESWKIRSFLQVSYENWQHCSVKKKNTLPNICSPRFLHAILRWKFSSVARIIGSGNVNNIKILLLQIFVEVLQYESKD